MSCCNGSENSCVGLGISDSTSLVPPIVAAIDVENIAALRALQVVGFAEGYPVNVLGYYTAGDGGGGIFIARRTSVADEDYGTVIVPNFGAGRWERSYGKRVYSVKWFGAKGDGTTNDTVAINYATQSMFLGGGGVVEFPTATYLVGRRVSGSQTGSILIRAGVSLDFQNSTLIQTENCSFINNDFTYTPTATITADVAAGDTTITVDSTAGLSAGQNIGIRLGDNAYDVVETKLFFFAKVRSVPSATSVIIDTGMPAAMLVGSTASQNRTITAYTGNRALYENCFIKNVKLVQSGAGSANVESGIDLRFCRNIEIENVYAENPGAGAVYMSYGYNNSISQVYCPVSQQQGGQASKGRTLNLVNCYSCSINDVRAERFQGAPIFVESYCRGLIFKNISLNNNWFTAYGTARGTTSILLIVQDCQADFIGLTVSGQGTGESLFDSGGTSLYLSYQDISIETNQKIKGGLPLGSWTGGYIRIASESIDTTYQRLKRISVPIRFSSSFSDNNPVAKVPSGILVGAWYYANTTSGISSPDQFVIQGANAVPFKITAANTRTALPSTCTEYGTDYPFNVNGAKRFSLYSGTVTRDTFVNFEFLYIAQPTEDGSTASIQNTIQASKAENVVASANLENLLAGGALYLHSPNGTRYAATISNAGAWVITAAP